MVASSFSKNLFAPSPENISLKRGVRPFVAEVNGHVQENHWEIVKTGKTAAAFILSNRDSVVYMLSRDANGSFDLTIKVPSSRRLDSDLDFTLDEVERHKKFLLSEQVVTSKKSYTGSKIAELFFKYLESRYVEGILSDTNMPASPEDVF